MAVLPFDQRFVYREVGRALADGEVPGQVIETGETVAVAFRDRWLVGHRRPADTS